MHTEKIIKFYFLFVMVICSTVAVGSDKNTQTFMANVLGYNAVENIIAKDPVIEVDNRKLDFEISKGGDVLAVSPGTQNVNIMKISFKTYEDELTLNGLRFRIFSVRPENIEKAFLRNGEEILSEGKIGNGFIYFENIEYNLDKNSDGSIDVFIDIGATLVAGERIRLDIQDPKDVYMMVGRELFDLKKDFPLKGKSLSIVSIRGWEKGYSVPKNAVAVK